MENVGNLVCPAAFELGESFKVVVLSVAEGDDKPAKYPAIFAKSKVLLINKIDLLAAHAQVDFDIEKVKAETRKLNHDIQIFPISAKTGEGMNNWYDWLLNAAKQIGLILSVKAVFDNVISNIRMQHFGYIFTRRYPFSYFGAAYIYQRRLDNISFKFLDPSHSPTVW